MLLLPDGLWRNGRREQGLLNTWHTVESYEPQLTVRTRIQEALLHALNAHASNWPTAVQNHALALLRSGEETTYPALLRRVLEDVRADSATSSSSASTTKNGSKTPNGDTKKVNGAADPAGDKPSLALPDSVVQEALRVTRESLEAVCDVDEAGS